MRTFVSMLILLTIPIVSLAQTKMNDDRKNEAIQLMRTTPEQVLQASKRLAEIVRDQDFGVRCQAAFTAVRLGQRFAEKIRSPELEKSLTEMISREVETKKTALSMVAEITEGRGAIWTVKSTFPTVIGDMDIKEGEQRKKALFMGPCLYSGIQALGEIRASSKEAFDLLKRLIGAQDKEVRSVAAYAMATLDCPTGEKLKVLQERQKLEQDQEVKDYIQGSISVLVPSQKPSRKD